MLLLTMMCDGLRLQVAPQEEAVTSKVVDGGHLKSHETLESAPKSIKEEKQLQDDELSMTTSTLDEGTVTSADKIKRRIDAGLTQKPEERIGVPDRSEGFVVGPNPNPDRTGLLFGLFPFFGGYRATGGRAHGPPHPPRPPPHGHHPHVPYKHNPYPKPQHIPKPPYKPHHLDYDDHKPEPLPPFPPDGPVFSDYISDVPGNSSPDFPDYDSEDFKIPEKDNYNDDHKGFDGGLNFDFDPPDFFEHSGIPHPTGDEYSLQHDEPYHEGDGDNDYPMKPYSDDDDLEFFPPENYDGFVPMVYKGPPKPIKHIPPGPKPGPPLPPHKFMFPPDLDMIVEKNIYRGDVPFKEVHNDRDKVTGDLDNAGINGLGPEVLDFIQIHTQLYVNTHGDPKDDHDHDDGSHQEFGDDFHPGFDDLFGRKEKEV